MTLVRTTRRRVVCVAAILIVAAHPSAAGAATWHVVPGPSLSGDGVQMFDISASSASNVWAVGSWYDGVNSYPLVIRWDGSAWRAVPAPSGMTDIQHVTALSSRSVWVSGYDYGGPSVNEEFARWDGAAWHLHPPPDGYAAGQMSAVSAGNIWAASYDIHADYCAVLHWDAVSWTPVLPFDVCPSGAAGGNLNSIAAITSSDVWTAGNGYGGYYSYAEAQHWDGQSWTSFPFKRQRADYDDVVSLSASSSTNVWAVGTSGWINKPKPYESWAARWRPSTQTWKRYNLPTFDLNHQLADVAANSKTDVWAVGSRTNASGQDRTYTAHWDGAAWSDLGGPNPGSGGDTLVAVTSVPGSSEVWAVGSYFATNGPTQLLLLRWS